MIEPHDFLNRAEELAPVPGEEGTARDWVRHYAAEAMAANAAVRSLIGTRTRGDEVAYLAMLGTSAAATTIALECPTETAARRLWELTPEAGDLNGEIVDYLADVLELCEINPADLYPWFEAADFASPLRLPRLEVDR